MNSCREWLKDIERKAMVEALIATSGNVRQASIKIRMPYGSMQRKLKQYGIKITKITKVTVK